MGTLLIDRRAALVLTSACVLRFLISPSRATAQARGADDGWLRFVGEKFGTSIDYPPGFTALPEPDAHDGRTFVTPDGARIAAFGSFNIENQSLEAHAAALASDEDHARVTYRTQGADFLVLSGLRKIDGRESVFYERYHLPPGGETIHGVVITYPVESKAIYDPLVGRIAGSLKEAR